MSNENSIMLANIEANCWATNTTAVCRFVSYIEMSSRSLILSIKELLARTLDGNSNIYARSQLLCISDHQDTQVLNQPVEAVSPILAANSVRALNGEYQLQPDQLYFVLPASKLQYPITASDMAALAAKASLALSHSLHKSSSNSSSYNKPSSSSSSSSSIRQGRHHRARARQNNMARISPFFLEEVNINNNTSTSKSTSTSKRDNHHQRVPSSSNSDGKHYYYYEMVEEDRDELKGFSDKSYPEEALGVAGGGGVLSSSVSEKKSMRIRSKQRQKNRYRYSGGAKVAVRSFRIQLTTIYEGSVLHFY
ncbi:uncharacterized protein LOC114267534 [Camellia sinensis]|uniref:uncharacterized protein LOC114267534 n=1 Tax=Camellia sinensis TaxID=4442 RepID=UPI001036032D|nr:uncharacterized protein LOC114267534 [Camellia sinensis]